MKRLATAIGLIALIGTPVLAADLNRPVYKAPPPAPAPVCMWCGFYIGLNAGADWTNSDFTSTMGTGGGFFTPASIAFINSIGNGSGRGIGFIGGGQVGYNWQFGNYVVGLEADIDGLSNSNATFNAQGMTPGGSAVTLSNTLSPKWLATFRPRVGVTANQFLFYATGGLAILNSTYTQAFTNVTPAVPTSGGGGSSTNTTKAGWVAGGGVEYALSQQWSIRAEYLFSRFSGVATAGLVFPGEPLIFGPNPLSGTASQSIQIARGGINYRF